MNEEPKEINKSAIQKWVKRFGFYGFMFFLVKGLLWLTVPALIAYFSLK